MSPFCLPQCLWRFLGGLLQSLLRAGLSQTTLVVGQNAPRLLARIRESPLRDVLLAADVRAE
jgi:hypothetical protein